MPLIASFLLASGVLHGECSFVDSFSYELRKESRLNEQDLVDWIASGDIDSAQEYLRSHRGGRRWMSGTGAGEFDVLIIAGRRSLNCDRRRDGEIVRDLHTGTKWVFAIEAASGSFSSTQFDLASANLSLFGIWAEGGPNYPYCVSISSSGSINVSAGVAAFRIALEGVPTGSLANDLDCEGLAFDGEASSGLEKDL